MRRGLKMERNGAQRVKNGTERRGLKMEWGAQRIKNGTELSAELPLQAQFISFAHK